MERAYPDKIMKNTLGSNFHLTVFHQNLCNILDYPILKYIRNWILNQYKYIYGADWMGSTAEAHGKKK